MVKRLLDAGANVQCAAGSFTPLHVLAEKTNTLIVDYLLEAGADGNALSPKGDAALYFASIYGNLYVIRKAWAKELKPGWQLHQSSLHLTPQQLEATPMLLKS